MLSKHADESPMANKKEQMSMHDNVIWGIKWGLAYSAFFCAWALVVFLIAGAQPFKSSGTSILRTLTLYLAGGVISGGIVGGFRPLLRSRVAAAAVGILAAAPVCVMIKYTIRPGEWTGEDTVVAVALALVYGGIGGPLTYRVFTRSKTENIASHD
jgi:hypothetical protein